MSSSRSRKPPVASQLEPSELSTTERLIFSQAVHEFGSDAWAETSKLLSKHPLIARPRGTFNPQSCRVIYLYLMEEAGLDSSEAIGPKSPLLLKLAQRHYTARVKELRQLIAAEETKFKTLVTEIDEIRNGLWDSKITEDSASDPPAQLEVMEQTADQPNTLSSENVEQDIQLDRQPNPATEADDDGPQDLGHIDGEMADVHEENDSSEAMHVDLTPRTPHEQEVNVDESNDEHNDEEEQEAGSAMLDNVDEVIKVDNEEVDEDPDATLNPSEPSLPIPADRDEMAAVEETITIEPDADPRPTTPTDAERRTEGKRKASELETPLSEAPREKKRVRDESESIDDDDSGVPATSKSRRRERLAGGDTQVVSKKFQNVISLLHSTISAHRYGNIFHNPIKKSEAPDYHDIVKRPMDLKTIKARIKDGLISNSLEFQRDVYLMFANAMMYNRPGSDIYAMTEEMMLASENHIETFRHTEGFHRV